ncbi:uncharacterized protein LOC127263163 [Andrographis paniculata]|uniref:uncharacterized protein LOC127263163 n=1 Tax=Andrographis paniculata TaxID=175694 RepID=UPI0021E8F9AB|nr:uncharacterized protein LOC127263163 [Andrographis paniculata]
MTRDYNNSTFRPSNWEMSKRRRSHEGLMSANTLDASVSSIHKQLYAAIAKEKEEEQQRVRIRNQELKADKISNKEQKRQVVASIQSIEGELDDVRGADLVVKAGRLLKCTRKQKLETCGGTW